jgi:hypothetical protein
MKQIKIQWQDQFGHWQQYQTVHHEANASRTAQKRASTTGKRHRLIDEDSRVLDIIEP